MKAHHTISVGVSTSPQICTKRMNSKGGQMSVRTTCTTSTMVQASTVAAISTSASAALARILPTSRLLVRTALVRSRPAKPSRSSRTMLSTV